MVVLDDIRRFVDELLLIERFAGLDDLSGIDQPTVREIHRLGLTLDAWPGVDGWLGGGGLDAVLVHRPWGLPLDRFPDLGVLAYHLPFDERLTTGFNPWLADALGMTGIEPLGAKQGRPIGMIGDVAEQPSALFAARLEGAFGPLPVMHAGGCVTLSRVAVVGVLWPELVAAASRRGADLYVTGTWRVRAADTVAATGIAVALVGHRPPEAWGMRTLGRLIGGRWPELAVAVAPAVAWR